MPENNSHAARNAAVEELLEGSFDLHVHSAPDLTGELRMDALDTGRHAQEAGMAGFALKSHHYPTTPMALALSRIYPGLRVAGTLCLNYEVGGLNPAAVEGVGRDGRARRMDADRQRVPIRGTSRPEPDGRRRRAAAARTRHHRRRRAL